MRTPKSFYLYGICLLIFTLLEIKTKKLKSLKIIMNLFHVNINKIFTKNHCIFIGENLVRRVALIYLFFFFYSPFLHISNVEQLDSRISFCTLFWSHTCIFWRIPLYIHRIRMKKANNVLVFILKYLTLETQRTPSHTLRTGRLKHL